MQAAHDQFYLSLDRCFNEYGLLIVVINACIAVVLPPIGKVTLVLAPFLSTDVESAIKVL